jgi:hypothetical protein
MAKKKKTGKKRSLSVAQKRALAKGRAALAAKRKTAIIKPKRKKAATRKVPTTSIVVYEKPKNRKIAKKSTGGKSMAKAKSTVKKYSGAARGFLKKAGMQKSITDAATAVAGGVLAGLLVNKIPVKDARIKALLPIIAGIGIAGTIGTKNAMVKGVSNGMIILGTVALFKKLAPNVPMLAGEEVFYFPNYSPDALPNYSGNTFDMGDDVDLGFDEADYVSAANM